jgi:hypothetical protein
LGEKGDVSNSSESQLLADHPHTIEREGSGDPNAVPFDPNEPLTSDAGQPVGLSDENTRQLQLAMAQKADLRSYADRRTIRVHAGGEHVGTPVHVWRDEPWFITNFLEELFNDFASGDAYDRLGEFFYHLPEGFKEGATGFWQSLGVAWNGWGSILRDPKQLQGMPDDVKASFQQINAEIKDLGEAALEKDGGKRFAAKVGRLTGNAQFQAVLQKAGSYVKSTVVSKLVPKPVPGPFGAVTPPKPTIGVPRPVSVPKPPSLPPVPPLSLPVSQLNRVVTRASQILSRGRFSAPVRSLGTFLQRHKWACGPAQIRTAIRDLGLPVPAEQALLDMGRTLRVLMPGGTTAPGLAKLINKLGMVEAVVMPAGTRTADLARMLARFPHYKILSGIRTASGGLHWVRVQALSKSLAIIGDSASGQSIVSTLDTFRAARIAGTVVIVRAVP